MTAVDSIPTLNELVAIDCEMTPSQPIEETKPVEIEQKPSQPVEIETKPPQPVEIELKLSQPTEISLDDASSEVLSAPMEVTNDEEERHFAAIKIQSLWRAVLARKAFLALEKPEVQLEIVGKPAKLHDEMKSPDNIEGSRTPELAASGEAHPAEQPEQDQEAEEPQNLFAQVIAEVSNAVEEEDAKVDIERSQMEIIDDLKTKVAELGAKNHVLEAIIQRIRKRKRKRSRSKSKSKKKTSRSRKAKRAKKSKRSRRKTIRKKKKVVRRSRKSKSKKKTVKRRRRK